MHESALWTNCANARELSIDGNRLIGREIGELAADLWPRLGHARSAMVHAQHNHRPSL